MNHGHPSGSCRALALPPPLPLLPPSLLPQTVARPVVAAAAPGLRQQLSVIVASQNAVKINAVAAALRQALPAVDHRVSGGLGSCARLKRVLPVILRVHWQGVSASSWDSSANPRLIENKSIRCPGSCLAPAAGIESQSGVADQPWGDEETLTGAFNRVQSILTHPGAAGSLLVAIEGGVGYAAPLPAYQHGSVEGQLAGSGGAVQTAAGAAGAATTQQQLHQQQHGHLMPSPAWAQQWQAARQQPLDLQPAGAAAAVSQSFGTQLPRLECFAWVVVRSPCGGTSHARSASFSLPPAVSELMLREGLELGDADDRVFGRWAPVVRLEV